MGIYFDNAATTKMDELVVNKINEINDVLYANPSAMHRFGFLAEEEVKKATESVAKLIGAESNEIIWTSGGSESNNMAIRGFVQAYKREGKHIITTKIEHASVYKIFKLLENEGYEVTYLDVDRDGLINIDDLKEKIREDTLLVSIMYVNNEIGSVQKIKEIGELIKNVNKKTVFHVDFVQGFAKYKIDVKKSCIDLLSISSHKFHGPKGVGILYKNKNVRLIPLIIGGGQQNDLRSGTLNVPGIVGTKVAAEIAYKNIENYVDYLKMLKEYLINLLVSLDEKYHIILVNTKNNDNFSPHIVSISFKGIRAEVMLHALEESEIYVSAGSACSSHDKKTSNTLISIGLAQDIAESTIRVSFSKYNNKDEIDIFIKVLGELIPKLLLRK